MATRLEFETPENIRVGYEPAGLGTRFMAWSIDNIVVTVSMFVIFILLLVGGLATETVMRDFVRAVQGLDNSKGIDKAHESVRFMQYFFGLGILIWGLGSFIYFGCSELWLRGQTFGKRCLGLRVIRIDGFSLDPTSIFVRNIFRVVDQFPIVWMVPFLSKRSQRFGDMAAGTTVIVDKPAQLSPIRQALSESSAANAKFTFDGMTLKRLRPQDLQAIERIISRWDAIPESQQDSLLHQLVPPLVNRLQVNPPPLEERLDFLIDLLAAEYRRQHRSL